MSALLILETITVVRLSSDAEAAGSSNTDLELELINLTNADRATNGLPPLHLDDELTAVARERSQDMIARNYFDHSIPPNGELVFTIMARQGIVYEMAGENIGWTAHAPDGAARYVEEAFMNSDSHKANILRAEFTAVGVGATRGQTRLIFTVLFLRPHADGDSFDGSSEEPADVLGVSPNRGGI